uniref:RanBP2-type domain-containing protein n=1 Tax=Anopheles maculatus TaxID=74869 RepID=A0A182T5T2_9DIPT
MSQRGYIPDEPSDGEEEDELIRPASGDSNETLEDGNPTQLINTSNNESEQSFVDKIRSNVSSVLSRMIRTAKDRLAASTRPRDYDQSETQPAKRRRLQEAGDGDEGEFPQLGHASNVRNFPVSASRVDRSCQTDHSDTADNDGRIHRTALPGSSSVTSVFARVPTSARGCGESSLFGPPIPYPKQTVEAGSGKRRREENDEDAEEEEETVSLRQPIEPFDPFKFLTQIDNAPVDPKRRLSGFLGNRCYQRRQQQLRSGIVGKYFFASHQKPNKNLDSTSTSETVASPQRPSFSRAAYRTAASGQRIPPEYGGSSFYNGLTCYGGASAVNTLGTHYTATRSTLNRNNSVLVRKPPLPSHTSISRSNSASSTNVNASSAQEPGTSGLSTTKQRLMEIWTGYDTARQSTHNVQGLPTSASVGQELHQLVNRARPYAGTSCIPQMLQLLREQKLASGSNVRTEADNYPPTVPLIDVRPLYVNEPIERRETSSPSDERRTTMATSASTDAADPVVQEEEVLDQPTTAVLRQQQLPSELREEHVPTFDITEPSQSRSPFPVDDEEVEDDVSVLADEHEDDLQRDVTLQQPVTSTPMRTPVHIAEDQQFFFADPIGMTAGSGQGTEGCPVPAASLAILFDEPELLHQQQPAIRSFQELMAESANKWICDVCMVRNEPHQTERCVACESPKPSQQKKQEPQQPPLPLSLGSGSSNFAAIVSAQSARWECDACCVRNEPTTQVCVCCGSSKSGGSAAEAVAVPTPEQPTKANDMMTTMTATTDSPFSNMPDLKDAFKSLLEQQNTGAMWKRVYDLCQTPDADEQCATELGEQSQPNDRFGSGSTFNGVHSFGADPAERGSYPFQSAAASVSQPSCATVTTRSKDKASTPPKPSTSTGLQAAAKLPGNAPVQGSELPFHGTSMFGVGSNIANPYSNNNVSD